MANAIFTVKSLPAETDGRPVYEVTSATGTTYHVYVAHGKWATEVATLAKLTNGGRSWRWAKDVATGKAAEVVAAVRDHVAAHGQTYAKGHKLTICSHCDRPERDHTGDALCCPKAAPVAAAPAVRPGRSDLKPENWQTLAQTLQSTLGGWLSMGQLGEFAAGAPLPETIARAADSARKVIRTTYNAMQRAACAAILETMEAYGLIGKSAAAALTDVDGAINSARQQYRIAYRAMCAPDTAPWHFHAGAVNVVLLREGPNGPEVEMPILVRNVQNYSEQMAVNALVRALENA